MQYQRIFVTLRQDRQDYSIDGRKSMGRCVIETKGSEGKLSLYVQGLKPEVIYKLYLVSTTGMKSVGLPIAVVPIDMKGKGELRFEFNAQNVGGSGMTVEDFNTVALIVPSTSGVLSVLVGHTDEEVNWKNHFVDITKEEARKIVAAENKSINSSQDQEYNKENNEDVEIESTTEKAEESNNANLQHKRSKYVWEAEENKSESIDQSSQTQKKFESKWEVEEVQEKSAQEESVQEESVQESRPVQNEESESDDSMLVYDQAKQKSLEQIQNEYKAGFTERPKDSSHKRESDSVHRSRHVNETRPTSSRKASNLNDQSVDAQDSHKVFKELIEEYDSYMKNLGKKPFDGLETVVSAALNDNDEPDELESVFLNHMKMNPFPNDYQKIKWARITLKDLMLLGDDGYYILNHPLVLLGHRRYKHLILGKVLYQPSQGYGLDQFEADTKYILGVPDSYSVDYKEKASRAGFHKFRYCETDGRLDDDYGYWLKEI